jgi:hypothetical protein
MSMSTRDEWDDWREQWRVGRDRGGPLALALERARRARRMRIGLAAGRVGLVLLALAGLAFALRHAGSPLEVALGGTAGVAIVVYALAQVIVLRRERRWLAARPDEYVAALYEIEQQKLRFVRFAWSILFLELAFLIPWWLGGIPVHAHEPGARIVIVGFWLPIAAIVGFVTWSAQFRRRARAEMTRLKALSERLDHEQTD